MLLTNDAKKLSATGIKAKAQTILDVINENPYQTLGKKSKLRNFEF